MPLTSQEQMAAALRRAQRLIHHKSTTITTVAGNFSSTWTLGPAPAAGSAAIGNTTSGVIPTSATTGAFPFTNTAGGKSLYIGRWEGACSTQAFFLYYDRLWHAGTYAGTALTTFNLSSQPSLTRPDANGVAAEIWVEVVAAFTATATTIAATYTNQAGATGHTTLAVAISTTANRVYQLPLAAGDTGVRKIESITVGGTADATGTFNVLLIRRIFGIDYDPTSIIKSYDHFRTGMPKVEADACIGVFVAPVSTSSGVPVAELWLVSD